jgi:uncharacterized protein
LRILETGRESPLLAATFNGRYRTLNTKELLRAFFALNTDLATGKSNDYTSPALSAHAKD